MKCSNGCNCVMGVVEKWERKEKKNMERETRKTHIICILCRTSSYYPVTQEWEGSRESSELILLVISLLCPQGHTSGRLPSLSPTLRPDSITQILGPTHSSTSVSSDTIAAQADLWYCSRQQKAGSVNSPEIGRQ